MCLVTVRFSKSFQKVFNLLRSFFFLFFLLIRCFLLIFSFVSFSYPQEFRCTAPVYRLPKWCVRVRSLFFFQIFSYLFCAGTGVKCTRNVSSIQLLTVLYVSIHSTFSQFVVRSNASNGVSWCTRFVHRTHTAREMAIDSNATIENRLFCECVQLFLELCKKKNKSNFG